MSSKINSIRETIVIAIIRNHDYQLTPLSNTDWWINKNHSFDLLSHGVGNSNWFKPFPFLPYTISMQNRSFQWSAFLIFNKFYSHGHDTGRLINTLYLGRIVSIILSLTNQSNHEKKHVCPPIRIYLCLNCTNIVVTAKYT